jgi:hypothetical protein
MRNPGKLQYPVRVTLTIDSGRVKPHAQKGLSVRHFLSAPEMGIEMGTQRGGRGNGE